MRRARRARAGRGDQRPTLMTFREEIPSVAASLAVPLGHRAIACVLRKRHPFARGFAWLPKFLAAKYLSTSVNTPEVIVFNDERLKMNHKITKVKWDPEGKDDVVV